MLRITKTEEHALRLVMRLARRGVQQTLAELAGAELLPEPTVAKLLGRLREGGIVAAQRGRHGGYGLAAAAHEISVAQVLRALRVPVLATHTCNGGRPAVDPCPRLADCGLRAVWEHLETSVTGLLERITVRDLLQAEAGMRDRVAALWAEERAEAEPRPATLIPSLTRSQFA